MGGLTRTYVIIVMLFIFFWLDVPRIDSSLYNSHDWKIVMFVFEKHGYDVAVCLEDMTFIRGDGERAGEVCRIILPERLRV